MTKILMPTLAAALVFGLSAHADTVTLTFTQPSQQASAPGLLAYTGTITNTSAGAVYLNGDSFNLDEPYLVDDSPMLGAPQFLSSGQSYTGELFDVELNDPLTEGTFNGSFTLLGGADDVTQDRLTTESFSLVISTATPATVTPEPSSLLLLFTGAAVFAWCGLAKRLRLRLEPCHAPSTL